MKSLPPADAIVALAYVMPDTPIRTLTETVLRLYESGYTLTAPEPVAIARPFATETSTEVRRYACEFDGAQICGYLDREMCATHATRKPE